MMQSQLPEWRALIEQCLKQADNPNTASYLQLATLSKDGKPTVRTMVFRGFSESDHSIVMCTDKRSDKCWQHDMEMDAQIAWYFVDNRTQFRLSGIVSSTTDDGAAMALRDQIWSQMSDNAKQSFVMNSIAVNQQVSEGSEKDDIALNDCPIERPVEDFVVIRLIPDLVESLDLRSMLHQRSLWRRGKGSSWRVIQG